MNFIFSKPCTGNLRLGAVDISSHKWFDSTNFEQMYNREYPAPYVPTLSSAGDTSNFDEYDEEEIKKSDKLKYGKEFANFYYSNTNFLLQ